MLGTNFFFLRQHFAFTGTFGLFPDVSNQISAVSSTFSVTDHRNVIFICFEIFSSMFPILNNILKFKMKSLSLCISKHASRIT